MCILLDYIYIRTNVKKTRWILQKLTPATLQYILFISTVLENKQLGRREKFSAFFWFSIICAYFYDAISRVLTVNIH